MLAQTRQDFVDTHATEDFPWDLLSRYNTVLPRYTSYPTVPHWQAANPSTMRQKLQRLGQLNQPISLYAHIPFCARMCFYCGCNALMAKREGQIERYLQAMLKELQMVREHSGTLPLSQLHFGGGTPTMLSPDQLERLIEAIFVAYQPIEGAELSIEVDPMVTHQEHLVVLRQQGFNRISLGVQDFDWQVQRSIGRNQSAECSTRVYEQARKLGFASINIDLMYGLPLQTPDHLRRSTQRAAELGACRVALFGYAHVPWMKPNQRKLEPLGIPKAMERWQQFATGRATLLEAGYAPVGFDHFAKHDDELVLASKQGRLHRNFQGYTVQSASHLVGIGVSAISDLPGVFLQNDRKLGGYLKAAEAGQLATEKGVERSFDDALRRDAIVQLMCNLRLDLHALGAKWGIASSDYFAQELAALDTLADDDLVTVDVNKITVTERGRVFVRNVAAVFDAYLPKGNKQRMSSSV